VWLILLLGLALRLHQLGTDSLWGDEIFAAMQSPLPVGELLRWTAGDIHPPAYYVLVGRLADWLGWASLTPSPLTDWLWRFLSVLIGTLAVAVTYRLGVDLLGRKLALAGALLLALSPVAVKYSQEVRMHELFLLGVTASTWTLARALSGSKNRRWWLAYGVATALNLYTVYLAFVVLAAQAVWVLADRISLARRPGRANLQSPISSGMRQILGWMMAVLLAFALYLPWWPTVLKIVMQRLAVGDVEAGVGSPVTFVVKAVNSLGPGAGWSAWLFVGLWLFGVVSLVRRQPSLALFGALWLLLPLTLPFVFRDPRALHVRYAFVLPVYLLFVAQGGMALVTGAWKLAGSKSPRPVGQDGQISDGKYPEGTMSQIPNRAGWVVMVVLAVVTAWHLPAYYRQTKPDWRGAARYLEGETIPGDVIVTGPLFDVGRYLDYYYDGPAELVTPAFLVSTLPDRVDSMRVSGGRVWAVTRFRPQSVVAVTQVAFSGLTVSEPTVAVYEPDVLTAAMIDLMQQAVAAAPTWAAEMEAAGVLTPDPESARAAAYFFLGDTYRQAGHLPEAIAAYQAMVADEPASVGGHVTLAEAYEAAGQWQAASEAYRQAVTLNPDWHGPQTQQAAALADAGEWARAVAAYRAIVEQ
jgi:Tfp pilus assembly protein PilF